MYKRQYENITGIQTLNFPDKSISVEQEIKGVFNLITDVESIPSSNHSRRVHRADQQCFLSESTRFAYVNEHFYAGRLRCAPFVDQIHFTKYDPDCSWSHTKPLQKTTVTPNYKRPARAKQNHAPSVTYGKGEFLSLIHI